MTTIERDQLRQLVTLQLLRRRAARIADPVVAYYDRPADFARECIKWPEGRVLAPYQADTMDMLAEHHRMSLRSLRGAGKSTTAALIVLWFAVTRDANGDDWKIITTAGSWGQLINFLWPEIKKWASKLKWDIIRKGRPFGPNELLNLNLRLQHGAASAAASSNPGRFEGAHADQLLYVFDEAKVIPASIFDSAEGALTGHGAYAVMIQTAMSALKRSAEELHEINMGATAIDGYNAQRRFELLLPVVTREQIVYHLAHRAGAIAVTILLLAVAGRVFDGHGLCRGRCERYREARSGALRRACILDGEARAGQRQGPQFVAGAFRVDVFRRIVQEVQGAGSLDKVHLFLHCHVRRIDNRVSDAEVLRLGHQFVVADLDRIQKL